MVRHQVLPRSVDLSIGGKTQGVTMYGNSKDVDMSIGGET